MCRRGGWRIKAQQTPPCPKIPNSIYDSSHHTSAVKYSVSFSWWNTHPRAAAERPHTLCTRIRATLPLCLDLLAGIDIDYLGMFRSITWRTRIFTSQSSRRTQIIALCAYLRLRLALAMNFDAANTAPMLVEGFSTRGSPSPFSYDVVMLQVCNQLDQGQGRLIPPLPTTRVKREITRKKRKNKNVDVQRLCMAFSSFRVSGERGA